MRTVGVIAGLGPLAGAHFYERLIVLTGADSDAAHLPIILLSDPATPSRVDHLMGRGPSPTPWLCAAARKLQRWRADVIAIPSATTHAYYDEIARAVSIPVVNLLQGVGRAIDEMGLRRPAFLATCATAMLRLFDSYVSCRVDPIYPDALCQLEVQALIDAVKGGCPPRPLRSWMRELVAKPWACGADGIVLACTELPLLADSEDVGGLPIISVTDILALATIAACRP
jgi:aspartate racemase